LNDPDHIPENFTGHAPDNPDCAYAFGIRIEPDTFDYALADDGRLKPLALKDDHFKATVWSGISSINADQYDLRRCVNELVAVVGILVHQAAVAEVLDEGSEILPRLREILVRMAEWEKKGL
jgi:hypothetical protein